MNSQLFFRKLLSTSLSVLIFTSSISSLPLMAMQSDVQPMAASRNPTKQGWIGWARSLAGRAINAVSDSVSQPFSSPDVSFEGSELELASTAEDLTIAPSPARQGWMESAPSTPPFNMTASASASPSRTSSDDASDSSRSGRPTVLICSSSEDSSTGSPGTPECIDISPDLESGEAYNEDLDAPNPAFKAQSWKQKIWAKIKNMPKKTVACVLVSMPLAWFSAEAIKTVMDYEMMSLNETLLGFQYTHDKDGEVNGETFNDSLGSSLSYIAFVVMIVPNIWEFASLFNNINFKKNTPKNWPKVRMATRVFEVLYALANSAQYILAFIDATGQSYLLSGDFSYLPQALFPPTNNSNDGDASLDADGGSDGYENYTPIFLRSLIPYFLNNLIAAQASAATLSTRAMSKLSQSSKDNAGGLRSELTQRLRARALSLDKLSDLELTDLWHRVFVSSERTDSNDKDSSAYMTRMYVLLDGRQNNDEEQVIKQPFGRAFLSGIGYGIGALSGVGLYLSGRASGINTATKQGLNEDAQQDFGSIFGASVVLFSAPVHMLAQKMSLCQIYDIFSGFREDGLTLESNRRLRQIMTIQAVCAGWVMAFPKIALAALALNGGFNFPNPAPMWQNLAVLLPLGLADGAIFSNGFQRRYDQMHEQFISKTVKPDTSRRLTYQHKKLNLVRDSLRIGIKEIITIVEQMPHDQIIEIQDKLNQLTTPPQPRPQISSGEMV